MPKPRPNESKESFMDRCMTEVTNEGKTVEQALGQCLGIWRHHRGGKKPSKKSK